MARTKATQKKAEEVKKRRKAERQSSHAPTRHSTRVRKQTVLHVAPDFVKKGISKKTSKGRKKIKAEVVAIRKKGKGVKGKDVKGRRAQDLKAQKQKAPATPKKGNERLLPRPELKPPKENPFFASAKPPEYVSFITNTRLLIRAIIKEDLKEIRRIMKPDCRNIDANACGQKFAYGDPRTPDTVAMLCRNDSVRQEYFKLKSQLAPGKSARKEPNLLQRKTTGKSNFYMLGRATRAVEMTRGGREGNNAFLKFEPEIERSSPAEFLVRSGMSYKELVKLSKEANSALDVNINHMDNMVVVAARLGLREMASAFAEGPAKSNMNDLHRETLKSHPQLPERILPVSVLKKGYNNANITPLHTAAINPNVKILERLRTIEPNINIPDTNNWYTIHYAAVCEGPEPLKFLLRNGAAPSSLTKQHETPLHVAARAGRRENIKILLDAFSKLEMTDGADASAIKPEKSLINARTRQGDTALTLAVSCQSLEAVTALLSHKTVLVDHPTSTSHNKMTPLMIACSLGNLAIAECLISHGALIMAKDHKKRFAISHAVINGQEHCAAMLLAKGAEFLKGDSSGNTPAHYAAAYGWLNCLKLLASVDPSCLKQENDWKLTPLSIAYLKGHYGIVRWLLEEKSEYVDINGKDMDGVTLLSSLLRYTDEDVQSELPEQIHYLLSRGADCSLSDSMGNAIMHVFAGINIRIRNTNDGLLTGMTQSEYRECFEEIMQHGGNVEARNESGKTPLHIALESANLLLFRWMLEHVSDVKKTLASPWSPTCNFLHALLGIPLKVWSNNNLWRDGKPPPSHLYDILPIINDILLVHCNGELESWLHQTNSDGLQPVLYAAKLYHETKKPLNSKPPDVQAFVDYITNRIMWVCQLSSDCLTMTSVPKKESSSSEEWRYVTSLVYYSLSIGLENGSLQLLKRILQHAVQKKKLRELLQLRGPDGYCLIISALKTNPTATGLLLRATKEYGCTEGVHNVVLIREAGPKNAESYCLFAGEPLNKSLAMLIVESKHFQLLNDLHLSQKDWVFCDAKGDNLWHYAARTQDLRAVELFRLLESKGVPIKPNNDESTPLHEAVQTCDCSANSVLEPIEWLYANSTQVARDKYGRTPLHYAFASREQMVKKELVAQLRDPIAVVSILARNMNKQQLDFTDCDGNTVLHLAAFKNANICAVTLLRKGVSVSIKNKEGNSALAVAVLHGRQAIALTLIQADSCVTDQVFPVVSALTHDPWQWKGAVKEKDEAKVSTIPAQIVARGGGWEALVYVLMDALGTDFTSLLQMIDASLKERQYNLANQLSKSLQARLLGKKLPKNGYNLLLTFAENFKGSFADDGVEHAILNRLYTLGGEIMDDGVSLPLEAAILNGQWALYKHFQARAEKSWTSLRPSTPGLGPLRNAVLRLSKEKSETALLMVQELSILPHFRIDEPLSLPLPYELIEASLSDLPPIAWACTLGNPDTVSLLKACGADVNAVDSEGRTPLMIALIANKIGAVQALCGDGLTQAAQPVPKKNVKNTSARLLLSALGGNRKRKPSESDNDERAESEDVSDGGDQQSGSGSEAEDEHENEEERRNSPVIAKIKINNKKLDLMIVDHKGKNFLHYMVEPIQWENVELFNQLYKEAPTKIKQLLQQKSMEGDTPLDIALRTKQRKIAAAMKAVLGVPAKKQKISNGVGASDLPDVSNLVCQYKVNEDSKQFIESWLTEHEMESEPETPKPSKMSGYSETAELVRCPVTQQIMSAVLNKTDLSYGRYGFHNFYRLELMKRRDTDLWILFTNWGRIGMGVGEFQTTPFTSFDAALKEFKSVWRSKTGQDWGPLDQYRNIPKKYRLVETVKKVSNLSEVEIKVQERKEEDMVRKIVQDLSNVEKLKDYAKQINWNLNVPFGHITEAAIERARGVLDRCQQNVKDLEATLQKENHSDADVLSIFEKGRTLSSEFYENFPLGDFEFGAVKILDNADEINRAFDLLNRLTEVEVATRILTAAAQHPELDRINYIKCALECHFTEMFPSDKMSQYILRYIHSTGDSSFKIKGIIALGPRTATLNFEKFVDDENQKFLWHGTKAVNLLSILKDGLLVDTRNTSLTGRLFGDGVYLADSFEKSSHYCQPSAKDYNYMLLCRTALGKTYTMKTFDYDSNDQTTKGFDSLHVIGMKYPKTSVTINGVAMPLCDFGEHSRNDYMPLEFSEYVVRDSKRILPQYLVIYQ